MNARRHLSAVGAGGEGLDFDFWRQRSVEHLIGEDHLDRFAAPGREAWLFPVRDDKPLSPRTVHRAWDIARRSIGRTDLDSKTSGTSD